MNNIVDLVKELLDTGLQVTDMTNEDEGDPTIWLSGNIRMSKLNRLRKAVGLAPLNDAGFPTGIGG